MAGLDRYGNLYNGKKRGRKPVERFGKKCRPSQLAAMKRYLAKRKKREEENPMLKEARLKKNRAYYDATKLIRKIKDYEREKAKIRR